MKHKDTINPKPLFESEKEKQEFTYPMWFQNKHYNLIARFESVSKFEVVQSNESMFPVGYVNITSKFTSHTNKDNWEQVENPNEHLDRLDDIVDEAIKEVSKEDSHNAHYKAQKIDTITRCKANMTLEQQKAICIFNIDRYLHREKGQNLSDIKKIKDYTNWLEEIENSLSNS